MDTADPEYTFSRWYKPGTELMSCDSCGSLVIDTALHTEWHRQGMPEMTLP